VTRREDQAAPSRWDGGDLQALLSLTPAGTDRFVSSYTDCNLNGSIFGGQLIGQAVHAALLTVAPVRPMHSIHASFLRPGKAGKPLAYAVERTLDGGSFTRRRIVGSQDDRAIISVEVSCHDGENGDDHAQTLQLDVPPPDRLPRLDELVGAVGDRLPPAARKRMERTHRPVDMRIVDLDDLVARRSSDDCLAVWLRISHPLPDDARWHAAAFGYLSDYWPASPFRMLPGAPQHEGNLVIASLDHALWIHRPCHPDEWLLAINEIPSEQQGRRLNRAQFFDIEGRLVASGAQEQVIRLAV